MSDIPKLTDEQASMLRLIALAQTLERDDAIYDSLCDSGCVVDTGPFARNATDLGRAALASYDAQKRAEILAPALDLLETVDTAVDLQTTSGGVAQFRPVILAQATIDAIRALLAKERP